MLIFNAKAEQILRLRDFLLFLNFYIDNPWIYGIITFAVQFYRSNPGH